MLSIHHEEQGQQIDLFSTLFEPDSYALHKFHQVLNISGYQGTPIYLYASCFVDSTIAVSRPVYEPFYPTVFSHYERCLIFSPDFMRQLEISGKNRYSATIIFAHEIGRLFYGHTDETASWGVPSHGGCAETQADYFSGFTLAQMGAGPQDLIDAQRLIFSTWPTKTPADSFKRILSLMNGWDDGGGQGVVTDDLVIAFNQAIAEVDRWAS